MGDIRRLFLRLGRASFILLIFGSRIVTGLMNGFANAGQMDIAYNLIQSIIGASIFYGYGFHWDTFF